MGNQNTASRSWNSENPTKLRVALAVTAASLALATTILAVAYLIFPHKARNAVASVERARGALGSALSAVPILPKLEDRLTVLVMGVDWNGNKNVERYCGTRSDTMMLVCLDPSHDKVGVISIPRDSHVKLGHGYNKINQAHAIGGPELAVETVQENFEIPVDNYVVVDTAGLKELFNLLGPIEVVVEKEMHYEDKTSGLHIDLKPGKQLLTPEQAEGYVRFRKDAFADLGRMERQQWFLRQALSKLKEPSVLLKAPQLIDAGYKCVKTDLPPDKLAKIMSFMKDLQPGSVVTSTLPGDGVMRDGVSLFALDEKGSRATFERFGLLPLTAQDEEETEASSTDDVELLKKRTRITIRHRLESTGQADYMAERLKDLGWKVRQIETRMDNDCLHAQMNLHNRRATAEVISLVQQDLPEIADWPVVLRYGTGIRADISLVLPAPLSHHKGMEGTTASAAVPPQSDQSTIKTQ